MNADRLYGRLHVDSPDICLLDRPKEDGRIDGPFEFVMYGLKAARALLAELEGMVSDMERYDAEHPELDPE